MTASNSTGAPAREQAARALAMLDHDEHGLPGWDDLPEHDREYRRCQADVVIAALCLTDMPSILELERKVAAAHAAGMREAADIADAEGDDIERVAHLARDPWQAGRLSMARAIGARIGARALAVGGGGHG